MICDIIDLSNFNTSKLIESIKSILFAFKYNAGANQQYMMLIKSSPLN